MRGLGARLKETRALWVVWGPRIQAGAQRPVPCWLEEGWGGQPGAGRQGGLETRIQG